MPILESMEVAQILDHSLYYGTNELVQEYSSVYGSCSLQPRHIRLIRIKSAHNLAPIQLDIKRVSLDTRPLYSALSYTWGSPPEEFFVVINDKRFRVRKKLWRFFHQRRREELCSEWIWVDAVCINQADFEERKQQVSLMKTIYTSASQVLVWLGPGYQQSDLAMQALAAKDSASWFVKRRLLAIWGKPLGSYICWLCSRQYWTRLWVFQELMLAEKRNLTILCGSMKVSWTDLENFLLAVCGIDSASQKSRLPELRAILDSPAMSLVEQKQRAFKSTTLWELMRATQHLQCSEIKDRVYGLLGVEPGGYEAFSADYGIQLPSLMNSVLAEHFKVHQPRSLEEVAAQCRQIAIVAGLELSAMFLLDDQKGRLPVPSRHDRLAFPLCHDGTGISLWWTSFYGNDVVAQLLADRVVLNGEKALLKAARQGSVHVVQMLLHTDLDYADAEDKQKRTSLSHAAECGHEAVVKLLLDANLVNVDAKDVHEQTPLSWAAQHGFETVVKLLLDTNRVDANAKDRVGRTSLSWAAQCGHVAVVKLFLDIGLIHVDSKDNKKMTPLSHAARTGHVAIVELLLGTGRVDADSTDEDNWTPLTWAAIRGHLRVVELLLATVRVNPDIKDSSGRTALSSAVRGGHESIVKLLLAASQTDVWTKDLHGHTLLSWAAQNRSGAPLYGHHATAHEHKAVVRLLLEVGRNEVDSKDRDDRTPLSWAAQYGHGEMAKLLLNCGGADINSTDHIRRTPLSRAAEGGHEAVLKLLLATGQADVESRDNVGQTPLLWAARYGHEPVVKLLLNTGLVDMNSRNYADQTPLSFAAEYGHKAVVECLLHNSLIEVDTRDDSNQTPLSRAAMGGHVATVKLLLETGRVDVDSTDKLHRTPLLQAVEYGRDEVVELLVSTGRVNANIKDSLGRTALSLAVQGGHDTVAKLLLDYASAHVCSKGVCS